MPIKYLQIVNADVRGVAKKSTLEHNIHKKGFLENKINES